jgi:hypothetical protein
MSDISLRFFAISLIFELFNRMCDISAETFFQSGLMQPLHNLSVILYRIVSCDVKLFVAATPISGPQFNPITNDDSCESDDLR